MRKNFLTLLLAACIVAAPALSQDVRNTYVGLAAQVADGILTNAKLANMANSTMKCRTTSGTGVPEDCTAAQAAAIVGAVGGALKSCVIASTRDLTTASGSQALTGCGFQPTQCTAFGGVDGSEVYQTVFGTANPGLTTQRALGTYFPVATTRFTRTSNFMAYFDAAATSVNAAVIASYDSDGLTLTWTKTGTPTGTAGFTITCYR